MDDTLAALDRLAVGRNELDLLARIKSSDDLMQLVLLTSAIRANHEPMIHLHLPYLPYARADRRFTRGDCYGLKAFASIINSQAYSSVITLDAHSNKSEMNIRNLIEVKPTKYIEKSIIDFANKSGVNEVTVLLPDEGSRKRYSIRPKIKDIEVDVKNATKKRDSVTGKLSGFEVPDITKPTIIIDDICDGGGTFIGIAKELCKSWYPSLALYTTHAIYSQGVDRLLDHFSDLYSTDSFDKLQERSELAGRVFGDRISQYAIETKYIAEASTK